MEYVRIEKPKWLFLCDERLKTQMKPITSFTGENGTLSS